MFLQPIRPAQAPGALRPARALSISHAALLLALLAVVTRLQLFGDPIAGSDEGFYLLVGDRMLHGALPYVDIWDRKPFGLFLLFAGMRMLGGDGVLAYKLVATVAAFASAMLVRRIARTYASDFGATAAGAAYLIWLVLGAAAGGQAEIFCNLPMTAAALLTLRGLQKPAEARLTKEGSAAMLLVGIALQIKYTALFCGIFLGCCWLFAAWRAGRRGRVLLDAVIWVLAALAPTLLAAGYYAAQGQLGPFYYANFVSIWQRSSTSPATLMMRLAGIGAVLAPLLACARPSDHARTGLSTTAYRFTLGWLAAAIMGLLIFGGFFEQYMLPVVAPASAAAALLFGRSARSRVTALLAAALMIGQIKTWIVHRSHGSRQELEEITRRIEPGKCLFVYSGLSAFYHFTRACIPTRFAFPSHLSRAREAQAIGTDPVQEVARVMATAPEAVVVRSPYKGDENWAARAMLFSRLADGYQLAYRGALGGHEVAVYRLTARR